MRSPPTTCREPLGLVGCGEATPIGAQAIYLLALCRRRRRYGTVARALHP